MRAKHALFFDSIRSSCLSTCLVLIIIVSRSTVIFRYLIYKIYI